jgi:hypothetical protein
MSTSDTNCMTQKTTKRKRKLTRAEKIDHLDDVKSKMTIVGYVPSSYGSAQVENFCHLHGGVK